MEPFIYIVYTNIRVGKLQKFLPQEQAYKIALQKGEKQQGMLLDTFENSLLKKALLLLRVGSHLTLIDLKNGQTYEQNEPKEWLFADELKRGPVASVLQQVSHIRAFLPVAEVSFRTDLGLLLDDEEKTRARFHNLSLHHQDKSISIGTTHYLRGYHKAHTDLKEALSAAGAVPAEDCSTFYNALGIDNRSYNPKPRILLDKNAPAINSSATIISTFISVARENEFGVVADLDTEFLHDYRVSFRKVRSVLSLFKEVFSAELTSQLKQEFAEIMQNTNRLRDLDVYLLERNTYFKLIPASSHPGLASLFDFLEKERNNELKKVIKTIKSKSYKKQLQGLEKLFRKPDKLAAGPKGQETSLQFGAMLILKRYNQVCKIAHTIDADTEDQIVHKLRISCKKLRYLMEFFTPLFPEKEIKTLIKTLKVLQDNLGKFNDYSVQQEFLRQILRTDLSEFREQKIQVTESIGALTAMLFRLQQKERKQVMKNFARFDNIETRSLFKSLFTNEEVSS